MYVFTEGLAVVAFVFMVAAGIFFATTLVFIVNAGVKATVLWARTLVLRATTGLRAKLSTSS